MYSTGPIAAAETRLIAIASAAHAIGALDAALRTSNIAQLWGERAAVVGLADCLALAGAPLTPAEFFRAATGLVEPLFVAELDRTLVSAVVAECLPELAPGSMTAAAVTRLLAGSRVLVDREWSALRQPSAALRLAVDDVLRVGRADVGTGLLSLADIVGAALATVRFQASPGDDWHGWLVAAKLPGLLARIGLSSVPLPCLTGLARATRFSTMTRADLELSLWQRLAEQARDGLMLLHRLEACARAWRDRLAGLTARSRAGQAAGRFLVWPACTRPQLAEALGVTGAGAGVLLDALIMRDIVERKTFAGTAFYVAPESLGDFKLAPRQGRHPALPSVAPIAGVLAAFDAELAAFDLLATTLDPAGIDPSTPVAAAK